MATDAHGRADVTGLEIGAHMLAMTANATETRLGVNSRNGRLE
jgi:hypothetical protein